MRSSALLRGLRRQSETCQDRGSYLSAREGHRPGSRAQGRPKLQEADRQGPKAEAPQQKSSAQKAHVTSLLHHSDSASLTSDALQMHSSTWVTTSRNKPDARAKICQDGSLNWLPRNRIASSCGLRPSAKARFFWAIAKPASEAALSQWTDLGTKPQAHGLFQKLRLHSASARCRSRHHHLRGGVDTRAWRSISLVIHHRCKLCGLVPIINRMPGHPRLFCAK